MDPIIGFPHGADTPEAKAFMVKQPVDLGVGEIDMGINSGALIEGEQDCVLHDLPLGASDLHSGGFHFLNVPS